MATTIHPLTGVYELDPHHSSVQFAVHHIVSTFRASFDDVEGQLVAGNEPALTARAKTESLSIVDPPELREHVVRGEDFFAADTYPELTFRSTRVDLREDGGAVVCGELTIRGVGRTVTAEGSHLGPTQDPFGAVRVALRLRAVVDRRDWGLDWQLALPEGGDAVGWDVELTAELELVRAG